MGATIKDVSRLAGTSIATVSNVITGRKYVTPELKKKVQDAMAKLSYTPNLAAKTLKTKQTFRIGVAVPDITNPFFSEILKNIEKGIEGSGYQLVLYDTDANPEVEEKLVSSIVNQSQVDGLILIAPRGSDVFLSRSWNIPFVIVDRGEIEGDNNLSFVYGDNFKAAQSIADYAFDRGYRRFVCIAGPEIVPNANSRKDGFLDGLKKHGISADSVLILRGEFSYDNGYSIACDLLDKRGYDPVGTAFFVSSDIMAWGVMQALRERGVSIGKDTGIISYDDIFYSRLLSPALTTFHTNTDVMGQTAGRMMLSLISKGKGFSSRKEVIDGRISIRDSC